MATAMRGWDGAVGKSPWPTRTCGIDSQIHPVTSMDRKSVPFHVSKAKSFEKGHTVKEQAEYIERLLEAKSFAMGLKFIHEREGRR